MRALSQYLRIYDSGGITYHRWQSYYVDRVVLWAGAQWTYVPYVADGITAGVSGDESNITITAPAIGIVVDAFETAILDGRLVDVMIYQFDAYIGNDSPQATQQLVASFTGQVTGGSATVTALTMQIGSALSPVGAQIPPRKFTTAMMGQGVRQ